MQRRHFLKISGFSTASLLFTWTNPETGIPYQTIGFPSEVSILSSGEWIRLTGSGEQWNHQQINVQLQQSGTLTVKLAAPGLEIEKIRLSWKRAFTPDSKYLGDDWERSYGELEWQTNSPQRKAPWYLLVHDGRQTYAFGVKTGAGSICYWQASAQQLDLFLDTHSGGSGVLLGERTLNAAEIITTRSLPGETPFQTDCRLCKMMCDKPVLTEKPVYGIN